MQRLYQLKIYFQSYRKHRLSVIGEIKVKKKTLVIPKLVNAMKVLPSQSKE